MFRILAVCALLVPVPDSSAGESFTTDVMAVLARGGCNQGACHGNLNGKGGFRLSLRGESPADDFLTLTRDSLGRRIDAHRPDDSLLLRKAAGRAPHEGGARFSPDSDEYRTLRDWIARGSPADGEGTVAPVRLEVSPTDALLFDPADSARLTVRGIFADGSSRDLGRKVVYEVTEPGVLQVTGDGVVTRESFGEAVILVRYLHLQVPVRVAFLRNRPTAWHPPAEVNEIDRLVFARLKELRLPPSELAPDEMFVRRAYLDAIGLPPTAAETRAFLDDPASDKRSRLIDSLINRPEFADLWAQRWGDLLRIEEKALDGKGVRVFHQWIRSQVAADRPMNEFARELIAGRGSTYRNPEANLYRSLREPLARSEAVAQVFLGVRIGCAKCHNHPFDRWTMDDYHRFAALFSRVQYRVVENRRTDKNDLHEFDGEQVVYQDRVSEWTHPRTKVPASPKLLGSPMEIPTDADRLRVLADWLAEPANPFFARTQANRVWRHLMGRGIVEPNDDFRATNPPTNPALLEYLADDLASHGFSLKHLVRRVMNSRTYQLSSVPNAWNADDESSHSRSLIRTIRAESLLDGISRLVGVSVPFDGYPEGTRAGQLPASPTTKGGRKADGGVRFLKAFGQPPRLLTCECERSDEAGVFQAFQLLTGDLIQEMIRREDNRLGRMIAAGRSDAEIVEEFYVAALSRRPTEREREKVSAHLAGASDRRKGLEDVVWALVNAKEFILRR